MSALARLHLDPGQLKVASTSSQQNQTADSFGFKWSRRDTYDSLEVKEFSSQWLMDRYCGGRPELLKSWLEGGRKLILDAGCGSGYSASLFFGNLLQDHDYFGVDISSSVEVAKKRFCEYGYPGDFLQCDIMNLPIPEQSVDMIFSEGVLHHTDSTQRAINYLAAKLVPGGRFLFYVYSKKAVLREFCDDYIREQIQALDNDQAWESLKPLTKLGIALGKLNVSLEVPEDVPLLGIRQGKYDLQRFFYWNICKLFYHPRWTLEEMNHANFDWYRPLNCHRQTIEEIRHWTIEAGLAIEREDVQEAGFTIVARKAQ